MYGFENNVLPPNSTYFDIQFDHVFELPAMFRANDLGNATAILESSDTSLDMYVHGTSILVCANDSLDLSITPTVVNNQITTNYGTMVSTGAYQYPSYNTDSFLCLDRIIIWGFQQLLLMQGSTNVKVYSSSIMTIFCYVILLTGKSAGQCLIFYAKQKTHVK